MMTKTLSCRVILCDLDGTLIDSAPDLHRAIALLLAEAGAETLSLAEVTAMIGHGAPALIARVMAARPALGGDAAAVMARFLALYAGIPDPSTRLYPGVTATLARLQAAGFILALCTNKPLAPTRQILARLDLDQYFTAVTGGDSLPWTKPDPRFLLTPARALGAEPGECVMIGDSAVDAEAAQSAGIRFILMRYGYPQGALDRIACWAALDRFDAVISLLMPGMRP